MEEWEKGGTLDLFHLQSAEAETAHVVQQALTNVVYRRQRCTGGKYIS